MKNLILFELRKLVRSKSFYVCFIISLAFLALSAAVIFIGMEIEKYYALQDGVDVTALDEMFSSSSAFDMMTSAMSSASLTSLFGFFVVIFLCDDYSQKTIKNVYSHGFTREQVFLSKTIVVIIAAFAEYILTICLGFLLGLAYFGNVGEPCNVMIFIDQFIIMLTNLSLAAFLCFAFRKIAVAIVILLFAPWIVVLLFNIADLFINSDTFSLAKYWFGNFELLIYKGTSTENILIVLIGGILYSALFLTLGWLVNRKNEM